MSWDEVAAKFDDAARHGSCSPSGGRRGAIVETVRHLERLSDLADLARLISE